jgi:hypothetical protein
VSKSLIPAELSLLDAAKRTVARVLDSATWDTPGGELDLIEVSHVCPTPHSESVPGVLMTWHQDQNQFGLVMPIERLAEQAGAFESVPTYLMLTVDEPHGPTQDGSRLWFFDLPSGWH